jgi:hypothetical protein
MLILDGAIESLRTFEEESSLIDIDVNGTVTIKDTTTVGGEITAKLSNSAIPYFQLFQDSAKVKRLFNNLPGVKEYEILRMSESKTEFKLTFEKKDAFKQISNYMYLQLPESKQGVSSWNISYMSGQRNSAYKLPRLINESYEYTIELPENMKLVSPSSSVIVVNELGEVMTKFELSNNVVHVKRTISLKKEIILESEYEKFSELIDAWINGKYKRIVLKME